MTFGDHEGRRYRRRRSEPTKHARGTTSQSKQRVTALAEQTVTPTVTRKRVSETRSIVRKVRTGPPTLGMREQALRSRSSDDQSIRDRHRPLPPKNLIRNGDLGRGVTTHRTWE